MLIGGRERQLPQQGGHPPHWREALLCIPATLVGLAYVALFAGTCHPKVKPIEEVARHRARVNKAQHRARTTRRNEQAARCGCSAV